MEKYAICFLCRRPNINTIMFAKEVANHIKVYMLCDSGGTNDPDTTLHYINVTNEECRSNGYFAVNKVDWIPKDLVALDKALFYFCKREFDPSYVWFVEDDVFIPRANIFTELNTKYPATDLITKEHVSRELSPSWPGWLRNDLSNIESPHFKGLSCAIRLSRAMLAEVSKIAEKTGHLVFMEFLFNSIAQKAGLTIETPDALSTIEFRCEFHRYDYNHLFHPVKELETHKHIRNLLMITASNSPNPLEEPQS